MTNHGRALLRHSTTRKLSSICSILAQQTRMHWSPIHIAKRDEMVMKEMVIAENGSIEAKAKGMITIAPIMINATRIKEEVYPRDKGSSTNIYYFHCSKRGHKRLECLSKKRGDEARA